MPTHLERIQTNQAFNHSFL